MQIVYSIYCAVVHCTIPYTTPLAGLGLMPGQFSFAHNVNAFARLSDVQGTSLPNSTPAAPVVTYRHQRYWVESEIRHTSHQEWWDHGGQQACTCAMLRGHQLLWRCQPGMLVHVWMSLQPAKHKSAQLMLTTPARLDVQIHHDYHQKCLWKGLVIG